MNALPGMKILRNVWLMALIVLVGSAGQQGAQAGLDDDRVLLQGF